MITPMALAPGRPGGGAEQDVHRGPVPATPAGHHAPRRSSARRCARAACAGCPARSARGRAARRRRPAASFTSTSHRLLRRLAKLAVKPLGHVLDDDDARAQLAGRASSTSRSDSVPPVEAPMQTIALGGLRHRAGGWAAPAWRRRSASSRTSGGSAPAGAPSRARSAARLDRIADADRATPSGGRRRPIFGLRITSTAPASSACIRVSEPASVSEEHITTGIGCWAISLRRKVMPSMRGISTSSVMTSGTSFLDRARGRRTDRRPRRSPRSPDRPTAARSASGARVAESSTIRTRDLAGACTSDSAGTRCGPTCFTGSSTPGMRLGVAEEQVAAAAAGGRDSRLQHRRLGGLVEIDQHVAAEDQVHRRAHRDSGRPSGSGGAKASLRAQLGRDAHFAAARVPGGAGR